jgi:GNAT superfamily N-acetyltransferase
MNNDFGDNIVLKDRKVSAREFNALRESVGWPKVLPERVARRGMRNTLYFVSAWQGGKPIGMARVIGDTGYAYYVQDVIVAEAYRGRGIGRAMMERVMAWIERHAEGYCNVGLMAAEGKEGFYERFGFARRPGPKLGAGMTQFNLDGWKAKKAVL